jgi:tRNA-dihydrouridine synthase B
MKSGFWKELAKPIIGLSPMDGVTDQPFRHIVKKYGQPDLIYTEFATVEGFCRGVKQPLTDFLYDETQRPIIAQIYGKTPDFFRQTTIALCQLGFDGVDINMGCPAKSVSQGGAGAGLIRTPELAKEIILATQKGVEDWNNGLTVQDCPDLKNKIRKVIEERQVNLPKKYQSHDREVPVSVKTRVGFDKPITEEWIKTIVETNPAAIALHGRTLKQGYSGLASWEEIKLAGETIKKHNPGIVFLGNGDTHNYSEAMEKVEKYSVDGVLIGRASFGNPWIFREDGKEGDINDRAELALEHAKLWEKSYGDREKYKFFPMRKHLAWYIKSFPNASEIRSELVRTNSSDQVEEILKKHDLLV